MKKWKSLDKRFSEKLINYGVVAVFFVVIQILGLAGVLTNSIAGQLIPICAYAVMAISLNMVVGFLGELSLGHAGFMSLGAFSGTICWMMTCQTMPHPVALVLAFVVGGIVAGVFGFLIGIPVLRLRGDYLAIVTLAFGEIIKNVMNTVYFGVDSKGPHFSLVDAQSLGMGPEGKVYINGAMGVTGITKASTFVVGIILLLVTLFVTMNLMDSRAGRAIKSIRDNRIAAESIGIPVTKYKMMAFITSASLAGMAGVLYALNFSTLVAKKFDYNTSILVLVFVVLGGMGNIRGSMIAAAVLTVLPELLRGMADYRMLIYAIVLIVMMIFNQSPKVIQWRSTMGDKFNSWKEKTFSKKKEESAERKVN